MDKQCFKCKETKPLSEFYKHPAMGDGHLGKCKTCTKRDVAENIERLKTNPHWLIKERERSRLKTRKARRLGKIKPLSTAQRYQRTKRFRTNNPLKYKAHRIAENAVRNGKLPKQPCEVCGNPKAQKHHDDYSKPLEVRWLCVVHHNEHHVKLRELAVIP